MAIQAPADLPAILKVRSEPMKKYVLSKLAHPVTEVEIMEDQWETIWKVAGDFIAQYFPREQKLAVFWTQPLKSTYPMPKDAYWVQQVHWDPVTTRIDDVFGAESFLFCVAPELKILAKDGSLQPVGDWKAHWRAKTPFGAKRLQIRDHKNKRPLPKTRLIYDGGVVEATSNHAIAIPGGRWREFGEITVGGTLCAVGTTPVVHAVEVLEAADAIGVRAVGAGCYYGCLEGEPVLLH